MSKKNMTSYVDHLAPLILSLWDIDDLSEWENEDENADIISDDSDCDYMTKVHYWFNKNNLLLGSTESLKPPIDFPSQITTLKPILENNEDSSLGKYLFFLMKTFCFIILLFNFVLVYTVSLKSDSE